MTDLRKAAVMALDALSWIANVNAMDYEYQRKAREPIEALRQALAQPEQEQLAKDQVTHGMSVTIDGKRIDPSSIYEMIKEKNCG